VTERSVTRVVKADLLQLGSVPWHWDKNCASTRWWSIQRKRGVREFVRIDASFDEGRAFPNGIVAAHENNAAPISAGSNVLAERAPPVHNPGIGSRPSARCISVLS